MLKSELCIFYLDGGTIGGSAEVELEIIKLIGKMAADHGLQLNHSNSEVGFAICCTVSSFLRLNTFSGDRQLFL